eukprot:gene938-22963_t
MYNVTAAPIAFVQCMLQRGDAAPVLLVQSEGEGWRVSASDTLHRGLWQNSNFGGDFVRGALAQPDWASVTGGVGPSWVAGGSAKVFPTPSGRILSTEVLEPNRVRETIKVKQVIPVYSSSTEGGGDNGKGRKSLPAFLVEFDTIFTGWISATDIQADPYGTVTFETGTVPICGSLFNIAAAKAGQAYCGIAAPLGNSNAPGSAADGDVSGSYGPRSARTFPEYNMVHEYMLDGTGKNGSFTPRFSYHEIRYLRITGASKMPTIVGHRVGNIATLQGEGASATATNDGTDGGSDSSGVGAGIDDGGGRSILSYFNSNSEMLNKIYQASLWTKVNLVTGGMSVDCPHRERLGY